MFALQSPFAALCSHLTAFSLINCIQLKLSRLLVPFLEDTVTPQGKFIKKLERKPMVQSQEIQNIPQLNYLEHSTVTGNLEHSTILGNLEQSSLWGSRTFHSHRSGICTAPGKVKSLAALQHLPTTVLPRQAGPSQEPTFNTTPTTGLKREKAGVSQRGQRHI